MADIEKLERLEPSHSLPLEIEFSNLLPQKTSSSIEKSNATPPIWESTFSKPKLDPPSALIWQVLKETLRIEELGELLTELDHQFVHQKLDHLRAINAKESEKIKEAIQREQEAGWWSFLKEISQLFLSALSTVFGAFLLSSGGSVTIGGMMIASGVLSIVNYTMQKAELWDLLAKTLASENETLRYAIEHYLPAAIGVTAAVAGLAGSAGVFFFTGLDAAGKVLTILDTASKLADNGLSVATGVSKGRLQLTQSELTMVQGEKEWNNLHLTQAFDEMKTLAQNLKKMAELLQTVVRNQIQAYQLTKLSI